MRVRGNSLGAREGKSEHSLRQESAQWTLCATARRGRFRRGLGCTGPCRGEINRKGSGTNRAPVEGCSPLHAGALTIPSVASLRLLFFSEPPSSGTDEALHFVQYADEPALDGSVLLTVRLPWPWESLRGRLWSRSMPFRDGAWVCRSFDLAIQAVSEDSSPHSDGKWTSFGLPGHFPPTSLTKVPCRVGPQFTPKFVVEIRANFGRSRSSRSSVDPEASGGDTARQCLRALW